MTTVTTYQLRPYQRELVTAVLERWTDHRRVMCQLATGGGKTVIFSAIANEFVSRGERVLILAHREELILQAKEKLQAVCPVPIGIIKAGHKPDYTAPVQVASVQSLINRLGKVGQFGLVVIDEAHHSPAATYQKILQGQTGAYHLGVTATPHRKDGLGFEGLFDSLVCGPSTADLIQAGYLCNYRWFAADRAMVTEGCRTQAGDYVAADIARENNAIELSGDLVRSYLDHGNEGRCLVFAVNVEHSQQIAYRYRQSGIRAVHLDGDSPADYRAEMMALFAAGEIKVISNCQLFTEGLDVPALEVVQLARPTQSLGLYLQMVGRGLRPAPGKDVAVFIDHTDNHINFGLPHEPRIWSLKAREKRGKGEPEFIPEPSGEPKEIEEKTSRLLKEIEINLNDGTSASVLQELIATQQKRGYKPAWLGFEAKKRNLPLPVLLAVADFLGYKRRWAYY
jgi:superfamily II DNA or RNA helicase